MLLIAEGVIVICLCFFFFPWLFVFFDSVLVLNVQLVVTHCCSFLTFVMFLLLYGVVSLILNTYHVVIVQLPNFAKKEQCKVTRFLSFFPVGSRNI